MSSEHLRKSIYGGTIQLETDDILAILPHRPPVLLVDRVLVLVPGRHGVGVKRATGNEYGLSTPRAGFVFPTTIAFEALVQLASLVLLYGRTDSEAEDGAPPVTLLGIESLQVQGELPSSETLHMHVDIVGRQEDRATIHGQLTAGGRPVLGAEFELEINRPPA